MQVRFIPPWCFLSSTVAPDLSRFVPTLNRMLKNSTSGVLTSLRGSTCRSVRLASLLAAVLLNGLFEHPVCILFLSQRVSHRTSAMPNWLFRNLLISTSQCRRSLRSGVARCCSSAILIRSQQKEERQTLVWQGN
jgi:hypothetical protein